MLHSPGSFSVFLPFVYFHLPGSLCRGCSFNGLVDRHGLFAIFPYISLPISLRLATSRNCRFLEHFWPGLVFGSHCIVDMKHILR